MVSHDGRRTGGARRRRPTIGGSTSPMPGPLVLGSLVLGSLVLAVLVASVRGAPAVGAASQPGSRPPGEVRGTRGTSPGCGAYRAPVDAPVVDPFRLPNGHYGAGNRGLEYATSPGATVRAIAAGRVTFAGPVAGRVSVSVRHADGRVSSLTGLTAAHVVKGELVARGSTVGLAGATTHLGVREDGRYVDPARLLCAARRRAVLVPGAP